MVQPAGQSDTATSSPSPMPLSTPQPAGVVTAPISAGSIDKRLAVLSASAPSKNLLLSVLPSGALTYRPQGSRFESLTAETLDNAGTSDDGFAELFNPVVTALGEDLPALASLSDGLTDAAFTPGAFAGAVLSPITADIADFQAAGDSALGDTASSLGSAPAPTAPAPAPAPTGGGGGGGGGGIERTNEGWYDPSGDWDMFWNGRDVY